MKSILSSLLAFLSHCLLLRYKPMVVGITGSVGKTSARQAIALVLKGYARIRSSEKNFNTELGVPLTIIGVKESPGRSLIGWLAVVVRACILLVKHDPSYPRIIVLEMGADRSGDITKLTELAPCAVGVLTAIGPAHLEKFGTLEALVKEKKEIVRHLDRGAMAVVNADDPMVYPLGVTCEARIISFGFSQYADLKVLSFEERYIFRSDEQQMNISFECSFRDQTCAIELTHAIGRQSLYAVLAALGVACALDIPLRQAAQDLCGYRSPTGRMSVIAGVKKALLIDDTYNSSPLAVGEALSVLESIVLDESARRIAVLGDMLELGTYTESEHRKVGALCVVKGVDILLTVGPSAKWIADGAEKSGIDTLRIFRFDKAEEVADVLRNEMRPGDAVLVKGSQGVRLERVVKEIMAEPDRASELLVRQGKEWV